MTSKDNRTQAGTGIWMNQTMNHNTALHIAHNTTAHAYKHVTAAELMHKHMEYVNMSLNNN